MSAFSVRFVPQMQVNAQKLIVCLCLDAVLGVFVAVSTMIALGACFYKRSIPPPTERVVERCTFSLSFLL
jgi:hypothetical protein